MSFKTKKQTTDSFSTGPKSKEAINTIHEVWFRGSAKKNLSFLLFPLRVRNKICISVIDEAMMSQTVFTLIFGFTELTAR